MPTSPLCARPWRLSIPSLVFLSASLAAACGGGGDAPTQPTPTPVASVDVSPGAATLEVGQTTTLAATPRAANGSSLSGRTIAWTSSDPAIAQIANGLVTAVAPGSATISAASEGRTGTAVITVIPVPVARVVLSAEAVSLAVGASTTLTAQTQSAAGSTLAGRTVVWSSTAPTIASVANGVVSAIAIGTAGIIATAEGRADTATITVTPVPVASVTVSPTTASLQVGATTTIAATARDASGASLTGRAVTWTSAAPAIATVAAGVVTAVAPGSTTVTATVEGQSASATITVTQVPVATVTIAPTSATVPVGMTTTLVATLRDAAGATLTGRSVTWSSSANAIATVSNGVVTGIAPGVATITAASEGRSATAQVTVTTPAATWTATNELRIGTIDTIIRFSELAVAADGRAVSASGTRVFERAADGTWNTTGTVIGGSPAVIRVSVDPNGGFWASGSNGVIVRRTASGWVPENTGTNAQAFQAIAFAADGSGFGVGNSANVVYRRSASGLWSSQPLSNSTILGQVGVAGANFAVTTGFTQNTGVGFQWNGATWTPITFPIANFRPMNLLVVSPGEAYISGLTGSDPLSNTRFTILEWNGVTWSVLFQRPVEVYAGTTGIVRCGDGTIYFGSQWGTIYRKQGTTFGVLPGAPAYNTNATLFCESDNSLWASINSFERRLLRYDGASWQVRRFVPDVTGLAMGANGDVFITTPYGVARRSGSSWEYTLTPLPNGAPVFIAPRVFASGTQALVGGAPAGFFNGTAWQWSSPTPSRGTRAMWGPTMSQVFAVGGLNTIDAFNGSSWSAITTPMGGATTLAGIRGAGNFALAVPEGNGSAVQWNGSTWSLFPNAPPFGWSLFEVFSPTDIVSLNNGTLHRWNGTVWSAMPGGAVGGSPLVMLARSASDIYIFRTSDILHYDGTSARMIGETGGRITAVAWQGQNAIAAGQGGLVLRATLPPVP